MDYFEQVCADIAKYKKMADRYEAWAKSGVMRCDAKACKALDAYVALRHLGLTMIQGGHDDPESLRLYQEACG
jgi:hypothetical protein